MKAFTVVLVACAIAPAVAVAAPSLDLARAEHVANKVRGRDLHNQFGLRARIGGAFSLTHATCERGTTVRRADCHYDAKGTTPDADNQVTSCTIKVTVRLRGRRVMWTRRVAVCARGFA